MVWRVAKSLLVLRSECTSQYPSYTYGTIGNDAHKAQDSDHNPYDDDDNPATPEVVTALDIMTGGVNALLAEQIRTSGHPDLKYVIHAGRIASKRYGMVWRPYTGSDQHYGHIHVSVGVGSDGHSKQPFDDSNAWGILAGAVITMRLGDRTIRQGDQGDDVFELRTYLKRLGFLADVGTGGVSGTYDAAVTAAVRAYQSNRFGWADGVVNAKPGQTVTKLLAEIAALPAPPPPAPIDTDPDLDEAIAAALAPVLDRVGALEAELIKTRAALGAAGLALTEAAGE